MKLARSIVVSSTALLLMSGMAFAQGMGGGMGGSGAPAPGGGSTPVTPAPGVTPGASGGGNEKLDLPDLTPATVTDPNAFGPPPTPINEDDDDGDDPRDTPPPTIYGEELESENDTIFYVLDISGSMGWDSQPYTTLDGHTRNGLRIDRAKAELARSIMGLSDNFKFNIIAFDCGTRIWRQDMQDATDANKASGVSWSMGMQPTGATGTGPATALALNNKDNMLVVLLTDGEPNCGANGLSGHRTMIRTANTQGATINVFGIAASGSYRAFCQGVAADAGGSYFDVP